MVVQAQRWWHLSQRLLALCITASLCQHATAQDQCSGPMVELLVSSSPDNASVAAQPHYGVLAEFGGVPSTNVSMPMRLAAANPKDACVPLSGVAGAAVLVERGNCSFIDKFATVLAANGSAMLLYDNVPGCINMGGNASTLSNTTLPPGAPNATQVPAISIPRELGLALLEQATATAQGAWLSLRLLELPAFDPSAIVLWAMAVATVVAGSLWAGEDHRFERKLAVAGGAGGSSGHGDVAEVLDVTAAGAVCFVCAASAMLLVFFFFLNKALFVALSIGFALASTQAVVAWLAPLIAVAVPRVSSGVVDLPWLGEATLPSLLALPFALALAAVWLGWRTAAWSWVLQDVLGISLMLLIMRTLRLSSMRVACILLPLCFAYDVFWVFLQPLLFGGGTSVMVEVAEGAGAAEALPMLLRVPRLGRPALGGYSMLGFGDVILPGLLVALCRRMDIDAAAAAGTAGAPHVAGAGVARRQQGSKARSCLCGIQGFGGYFVPVCLGYASGLVLTYVALVFSWFGDQGQPALLYLVPCTLGLVLLLGWLRGGLGHLFHEAGADSGADGDGVGGAGLGPGSGAGDEDGEEVGLLLGVVEDGGETAGSSGRHAKGGAVGGGSPLVDSSSRGDGGTRATQQLQRGSHKALSRRPPTPDSNV